MKLFAKLSTLSALALATLVATQASAEAPAQRLYIRVQSISQAGSGCPAGAVDPRSAIRNGRLEFDFDALAADAGSFVGRANCQILVQLQTPAGYTYKLESVELTGETDLDEGATATVKTSAYYQGSADTNSEESAYEGPVADAIAETHAVALTGPCGAQRALNVNLQALARGSRGAGGGVAIHGAAFNLRLARCN
jgi:hypothetical protein